MGNNDIDELESQEIWLKAFFNGYFFTFKDMSIQVEIFLGNRDFPENSSFRGTTQIYPGIDDKDGKIDITNLLHTFLNEIKENPDRDVKCFITSFSRQMHFNKDLLSTPIPKTLLDLFKKD